MELLNALNASDSMIMLSGYDCEIYRDMLPDWRMKSVSSRAERGAPRMEFLWMNRACAANSAQMHFLDQ
ncbi:MAG: hypothetical protein PHS57_05855 [Alphaproteobacteria bacterium]|nr:hypothetical protein [Alphaproteobacteria bacterium]